MRAEYGAAQDGEAESFQLGGVVQVAATDTWWSRRSWPAKAGLFLLLAAVAGFVTHDAAFGATEGTATALAQEATQPAGERVHLRQSYADDDDVAIAGTKAKTVAKSKGEAKSKVEAKTKASVISNAPGSYEFGHDDDTASANAAHGGDEGVGDWVPNGGRDDHADGKMGGARSDLGVAGDSDWSLDDYSKTITMQDFLKDDKVLNWLETKGLNADSSQDDLMQYVPVAIVVKGKPSALMGEIGSEIMKGYTTFSMQLKNTSEYYSASYNIVLDMRGHLVSISPVQYHLGDKYHFISWKPWAQDPDYMLGGVDVEQSQMGPAMLWKWKRYPENKPEYVTLGNGTMADCHDVSWAYDRDAYWTLHGGDGVQRVEVDGSTMTWGFDPTIITAPNHAQMLEKDTVAIISERVRHSIVKCNLTNKEIEWVVGGPNGTFDLIDENGAWFEAGTKSLWKGQHNVEYIGNKEYALFDDESHVNNKGDTEKQAAEESRLLIVKIDEDVKTAKIVWSHGMGAWTPIYGDNDKMPSGNMLGTMWVGDKDCPNWEKQDDDLGKSDCAYYDYDAEVAEITRQEHEVAWSARIYSNISWKKTNRWDGWSIYSAERVYTEPLVYDVSCIAGDSGTNVVSFKVQNSIKQYNEAPGHFFIYNTSGAVINHGLFHFEPFWVAHEVKVNVEGHMSNCAGHVEVTNLWEQKATKYF